MFIYVAIYTLYSSVSCICGVYYHIIILYTNTTYYKTFRQPFSDIKTTVDGTVVCSEISVRSQLTVHKSIACVRAFLKHLYIDSAGFMDSTNRK